MTIDLDRLLDHRSEPNARAVIEDYYLEHGWRAPRWGVLLGVNAHGVFGAGADNSAVVAAGDHRDPAADAAVADSTPAADAAGDDARDDLDDAAARDHQIDDRTATTSELTGGATIPPPIAQEPDMSPGLKVVQLPGRFGYSVTRVGWLRRVGGDEWELLGGRTIVCTSGGRTLGQLASDGPKDDHKLSAPDAGVEEIHRLVIRRSLPANVAAWATHCPMPQGWAAAEP